MPINGQDTVIKEHIEKGISPSLRSFKTVACPDGAPASELYITLFRTFNDDGSIRNPGITFRQTVDAPADGIIVHPLMFAELLNSFPGGEIIDIYKHKNG